MKDRESCDGGERVLENKEMFDSKVIRVLENKEMFDSEVISLIMWRGLVGNYNDM